MATNLYPGTFTENEVINEGATVSLVAGNYTKIGQYVVLADEMVGMGKGAFSSQNESIGRLYAAFYDNSGTPVAVTNGKFRIMTMSSQDIPIGSRPVLIDVDLAALTTGATNPEQRYVFPFDGTLLSKDKKFVFFIKNTTSSAITLSKANSKVLMDITRALI